MSIQNRADFGIENHHSHRAAGLAIALLVLLGGVLPSSAVAQEAADMFVSVEGFPVASIDRSNQLPGYALS